MDAGRPVAVGKEVRVRRRLVGPPPAPGARRLGVRVRQRQLPRHRRHRRGRPGPAPRPLPASAAADALSTGAWRGRSACSAATAGWGAFDVDNDSDLCAALPFCDFGEVTDPPSADVTAHVVEMLAAEPGADPRSRSSAPSPGCPAEQEADGSWFGRWGVNHLYGTGAAVPALIAAGVGADRPPASAGRWPGSRRHQNDRRRLGRGPALLRRRRLAGPGRIDRRRRPPGPSSPCWPPASATAPAVRRGIAWLVDTQRADGSWDEPWFTGTGFPWDFNINYHLYRLVFPLMALGRYLGVAR